MFLASSHWKVLDTLTDPVEYFVYVGSNERMQFNDKVADGSLELVFCVQECELIYVRPYDLRMCVGRELFVLLGLDSMC